MITVKKDVTVGKECPINPSHARVQKLQVEWHDQQEKGVKDNRVKSKGVKMKKETHENKMNVINLQEVRDQKDEDHSIGELLKAFEDQAEKHCNASSFHMYRLNNGSIKIEAVIPPGEDPLTAITKVLSDESMDFSLLNDDYLGDDYLGDDYPNDDYPKGLI